MYILADVFDATKDLYRSLTIKEQKEYEQNLRAKGYPPSRRVEYVREESLGSEDAIMTDKSTVIRQFEKGYHAMGSEFARGDGMLCLITHELCLTWHRSSPMSYWAG